MLVRSIMAIFVLHVDNIFFFLFLYDERKNAKLSYVTVYSTCLVSIETSLIAQLLTFSVSIASAVLSSAINNN